MTNMILVSSDGIKIPTNTSLIISVSPCLKKILSDYQYQTYEGSTEIFLPEYDAETVNTFLELTNIGDRSKLSVPLSHWHGDRQA